MVEKGELSREYCTECGSRKTLPLSAKSPHIFIISLHALISDFLSHSMSEAQLDFVFDEMLPKKLKDMTLVDVGSRLGAVLYYVLILHSSLFLFSSPSLIFTLSGAYFH